MTSLPSRSVYLNSCFCSLERLEKLLELELSVAIVFKQNRHFQSEKKRTSSGDIVDSGLTIEMTEMDTAF